MEITPRILTSFLVLAEEKHFRHAAERLFITGPALSQQIRQLEDGLKVRLFDRTSRSVELTAHGTELVPLAQQALGAASEITAWAQRASRDRRVLRVGFMSTGAGETTQHLLTAARDRLPDLDVQLHYLDWGDQLGPVQRGEVDLALVREPEPPSSLHTMPVLEESRVVLLPADHPLAGRESVRFDEIAGEVFLPSATGSQEWKDYWLVVPRPDGSEPVLGPATRSVEDMLEYVAAGRGISLTARAVSLFYAHPGVRFVPVADLPATRVLLVRAAESPHPDVLRFESLVRSLRDR
jgi:DNA-binding transcriptional LysR family regulator